METLFVPAIIIIASAVALWIITSARFRKDIGAQVSRTITAHASSMADNALASSVKSELDFLQDLLDDGFDANGVKEARQQFQDIIATPKPTANPLNNKDA